MPDYPPAVAQLLTRSDPRESVPDWPDYPALGLGPEHIPDLIRMAGDLELNEADSNSAEVWAPLHAWRALGQLRAEAATQPLLELLNAKVEDDDCVLEELPEVFALIGPPALPALAVFLGDPSRQEYARVGVAGALAKLATHHPQTRPDAVAILSRELEKAAQNSPTVNAFVIDALVDLNGVEAAPLMERAFAAGIVDQTIRGDWDYVQYDLGLRDMPPPRRRYFDPVPPPGPRPLTPRARAKARARKAKKERQRKRKRR
jgi:hypothetical protein